jgi:hypothetical protein
MPQAQVELGAFPEKEEGFDKQYWNVVPETDECNSFSRETKE